MKKVTTYLLSLLLFIGLVSSCTSYPEYGKMIPKDAYFVMNLNIEEAVTSADLGEARTLKDQLGKALQHAQLPQSAREQCEDIIDNPLNAGFDLREPVYLFASAEFPNKFGVVGAVNNVDDLENFFDLMSTEGVCEPVLLRDGLRFTSFEKLVVAFNEKWFFVTERNRMQQDAQGVLDEIRKLEALPEDSSMFSNEIFKDMHDRDGFMHMLFLGKGLEDVLKEVPESYADMAGGLLQGKQLVNFSLIWDAALRDGEMELVGEILPLNKEGEQLLDNSGYGALKGDLQAYVPKDALYYIFGNIEGSVIYEQMLKDKNFVDYLEEDPTTKEIMDKFVSTLNGDVAAVVGTKVTTVGIPEISVYAKTDKDTWLEWMDDNFLPGVKKIDDRTYEIGIPDSRYDSYYSHDADAAPLPMAAHIVAGAKKGISYMLFGSEMKELQQVTEPVQVPEGYNIYARLNAAQLLSYEGIKDEIGPIGFLAFKKIVNLFDYAECYLEDSRKGTFRIVMKNKEQSPVKTIYDEVEKILALLD